MVGINGCVNVGFLIFLFRDKDLGIQFLKDAGLIRSKVPCNTCGRDMTWCADPTAFLVPVPDRTADTLMTVINA